MTGDRRPSPPPARSGCLTALLIVIGAILLLPGLCALIFFGYDPKGMLTDSTGLTLLILCLAIAAASGSMPVT